MYERGDMFHRDQRNSSDSWLMIGGAARVGCEFFGMAEVSSCVVEALPGQRVKKSDEIDHFQYGGSTYCLIFEPGLINSFVPKPPFHDDAPPLKINGHVATAE